MPPGMWHTVYTDVHTMMSGGHFYLYEALHLVEMARFHDRTSGLDAANVLHKGAPRSLARMAILLRDRVGQSRPNIFRLIEVPLIIGL